MNRKNTIIQGTFLLTAAGIITKIIGFYYRIFLNNEIGASGLGMYQLIFPVFVMGLAFCSVGIQTSLSRMIAANENNYNYCIKILYTALFYSCLLSLAVMAVCYYHSDFIAIHFIKNASCAPLIKILSFSFIPASIHSCISGYCYGKEKTGLPAFSQLIEQVSRVAAVFLLFKLPIDKVDVVMWGLVIGEAFGALSSITYLFIEKSKVTSKKKVSVNILSLTKNLFAQAIPLTFNRLGTNLLQSIESIIFPILLCRYGYSNDEALSFLGIITGMALPLLLFPSALTNSLSVLLLSDVANSKAKKNTMQIRKTIEYTIECTTLIGIFCLGFFFLNGSQIGIIIFNSETAGYYIKIMSFLSPFIYLSSVLGSIIHGLGKTFIYFVCNIAVMILRLVLMWILMPVYGVNAYVYIVMLGMGLMSLFILIVLKREVNYRIKLYNWLIKPLIYTECSFIFVIAGKYILKKAGIIHPALILAVCCILYCIPFMLYFKRGFGRIKVQKNP